MFHSPLIFLLLPVGLILQLFPLCLLPSDLHNLLPLHGARGHLTPRPVFIAQTLHLLLHALSPRFRFHPIPPFVDLLVPILLANRPVIPANLLVNRLQPHLVCLRRHPLPCIPPTSFTLLVTQNPDSHPCLLTQTLLILSVDYLESLVGTLLDVVFMSLQPSLLPMVPVDGSPLILSCILL